MFTRYGVPNIVVTDNGPQFASAEFVAFAKTWCFQYTTSSPHYPQSNGKAENAVKTLKRFVYQVSGSLTIRISSTIRLADTLTEGLGTSPAQRFLGRRCRTLLLITDMMFQPAYDTTADTRGRAPGTCTGVQGPHSYGVLVEGTEYHRNR